MFGQLEKKMNVTAFHPNRVQVFRLVDFVGQIFVTETNMFSTDGMQHSHTTCTLSTSYISVAQ